MAVRAFDNWNSYLDNDGNLLHGKIRFCKKGTTDNVTIYNSDGYVALRNPEFTDMLGRTEYQVFVDSEADVTAYFYKYVGNGDMMGTEFDDYDPERWEYQYSSDNLDPAKVVTLEADTAHGVATMADMRAKDPDDVPVVNDTKFLWLYGYYKAGDKNPVLYVWDSASLRNDDGGAVICPSSVSGPGRWILASKDYIFDVRHFGIFGQTNKYSTDYSYTSQLSNCAEYLTAEGMNAWFPEIYNQLAYYLFDGTNTFSIPGDIYISDGVRFMCKTGTSGTAIQCANIHKAAPYLFDSSVQTGSATLTADWVNSSWIDDTSKQTTLPRLGYVIDNDSTAINIANKVVKFETNGNACLSLTNCQVESNKKITGPIHMENMPIDTSWFSDGYSFAEGGGLTLSNLDISLARCSNAYRYCVLKNRNSDTDYGDLQGKSVNGVTFNAGAVVANASLNSCTFAGDCELDGVTGHVDFANGSTVNLIDCWLTLTTNESVSSLALRRGTITSTNGLYVGTSCYLEDATISVSTLNAGGTFAATRSVLNSVIYCHAPNITDGTISGTVRVVDVSGVISGTISNNRILATGGVVLDPNSSDVVVTGAVWTNNESYTAGNWLTFDRQYFDADETHHSYVYEGNTGPNTLQRYDFTFTGSLNFTDSSLTSTIYKDANDTYWYVLSFVGDTSVDPTTDISKYLAQFDMFTMGTQNIGTRLLTASPANVYTSGTPAIKTRVMWNAMPVSLSDIERTKAEWQSEAQVGYFFPKGFAFVGGFTWRITSAPRFVETATYNAGSGVSALPVTYRLSRA